MKKSVMVLSLVVMGILFAGGVAFAANVRCEAPNGGEPAPFNTDNCELQYAVAPDGEPVEPDNGTTRIAQEIPDVLAALKDIA